MSTTLTVFDFGLGGNRPATQEDIDQLQQRLVAMATQPHPELPAEGTEQFNFRLAIFPNRMRSDGVFVAEDKEVEPYEGITTADGKPCYPSIPKTPWALRSQVPLQFASEIVRRWNAAHQP